MRTPDTKCLMRRESTRGERPKERADRVGGAAMTRYGFDIRTRTGQRVDNICIMAANQADAERRLRQMYHHCEIVHCQTEAVSPRNDPLDLEGVIGIIS